VAVMARIAFISDSPRSSRRPGPPRTSRNSACGQIPDPADDGPEEEADALENGMTHESPDGQWRYLRYFAGVNAWAAARCPQSPEQNCPLAESGAGRCPSSGPWRRSHWRVAGAANFSSCSLSGTIRTKWHDPSRAQRIRRRTGPELVCAELAPR